LHKKNWGWRNFTDTGDVSKKKQLAGSVENLGSSKESKDGTIPLREIRVRVNGRYKKRKAESFGGGPGT